MGKQINFFMNNEDENRFAKFVFLQGDILISKKLIDNKIQIIDFSAPMGDSKYYIFNQSWTMFIDNFSEVHYLKAEVIEFYKTEIERTKVMSEPGRLWVEMRYWADNKELVTKRPELEKKYNLYKRYITKNYKISEDKHYYIGPGAYELYKQGWKMMGGPKFEVKWGDFGAESNGIGRPVEM